MISIEISENRIYIYIYDGQLNKSCNDKKVFLMNLDPKIKLKKSYTTNNAF